MRSASPAPAASRRLAGLAMAAVVAGGLLVTWLSAVAPARASPPSVVRLGLAVHVTREAGKPAADEAFVKRQVATANRIFAPYGVAFERRERHAREEVTARVNTRAERNAFGAFVRPGLINLFVVTSLRDVDEPERMRRGVHWHSKTHAPAHYVILSGISFDAVLAHELGHFLGNRRHSKTPGNLMSYHHTDVLPFLDEPQQRRLRQKLDQYLRSGELTPLPSP